jgi:hypothetical protein
MPRVSASSAWSCPDPRRLLYGRRLDLYDAILPVGLLVDAGSHGLGDLRGPAPTSAGCLGARSTDACRTGMRKIRATDVEHGDSIREITDFICRGEDQVREKPIEAG